MLDSCDDAARELESAFGAEGGAVVCDLTTVDEGRDVDGLARVAARLGDPASRCALGRRCRPAVVARQFFPDEMPSRARAPARRGRATWRPMWREISPLARRPRARAAFVGPLRPAFTWDGKIHCKSADVQYIRAAAAAASRQGAPVVVVLPGYEGAQLRECARAVVELADAPAWVFRVARLDDQADLGDVLDLAPNVFVVADGWFRPCDRGPAAAAAETGTSWRCRNPWTASSSPPACGIGRSCGSTAAPGTAPASSPSATPRIGVSTSPPPRRASPGTARPKSGPPTSSSCNARAAAGASRCGVATTTANSTLCIVAAAASTRTGTRASTRPRSRGRRRLQVGRAILFRVARSGMTPTRPACGAACEEFGVLAARN